ncbi:MAG: TSUP family transporter [Candidatus Omnitrophica bacterium]|nr:TSUP family transporter [Candidatus Omnitrophota bacterium]
MDKVFVYTMIGLAAGSLSGLLGIGGAILIIPALVLFCGFEQHLAQGTSLALMLPPIGILAAIEYYNNGLLDVTAAAIICAAFVIGAFFGAKFALGISSLVLRRVFAGFLMFAAIRMFLYPGK